MTAEIRLRIYEELNEYLPPDKRRRRFTYPLDGAASVHALLKDLAVPEKEVELVLVNGASVDFSFPLHEGDHVSVYPVFESFNVKPLLRVRSQPLRETRFITGSSLSPLARHLRRLGFDVFDARRAPVEDVVCKAEVERRIVLSQNPAVLETSGLSRAYLVRAAEVKDQVFEVLARFDLFDTALPQTLQSILAHPNCGGAAE